MNRSFDDAVLLPLLIASGLCVAWGLERWKARKRIDHSTRKRPEDPLDRTLMYWSSVDRLRLRDLLNGGILIVGRTGSGKTTGSGYQIGLAIVLLAGSGGLILCSKPEDREFWMRVFSGAGRLDDLLIFEPSGPLRFNILDNELQAGADTREITQMIMTIGETLKRNSRSNSGENEAFWDQLKERTIYNAVEIIRKATGRISASDLQRFLTGAASNPQELANPEWQAGFHNQCLKLAFFAHKTPVEQHDYELALEFWLNEYPNMDQKPRSSGLADVLNILHVFCTGIVRQLMSEKTNVSPSVLEQGKWILVNMPIPSYGAAGAFVNGAWKYAVQRHILRRHAVNNANPIVVWCDEFQNVVNSFDATFLAECRSHRGAMVVLTQSIHSFYGSMPGTAGKHQADALLTNFAGAKIFHALGDDQTAAYASSLIGRSLQTFVGTSMQPPEDPWQALMGNTKVTFSTSEHYELTVQNNVFMNGLRTGGKDNGFICDAIVIRSGEPFASGGNAIFVEFSQR